MLKIIILSFFLIPLSSFCQLKELYRGFEFANSIFYSKNKLYVSDHSTDALYYADLNIANINIELFINNLWNPTILAIEDDKLYFTTYNEKKVFKVDLKDTSKAITTFLENLEETPNSMAFFEKDLYLSYYLKDKVSVIKNINNSRTEDSVLSVKKPRSLKEIDGSLYCLNAEDGELFKINTSNNSKLILLSNISNPMSFEKIDNYFYISEFSKDRLIYWDENLNTFSNFDSIKGVMSLSKNGKTLYISEVWDKKRILKYEKESLKIEKSPQNSKVLIYPNPTKEYVFISTDENCNFCQAEIYDALGRFIKNENLSRNFKNKIDLNGVEKGTIFILVKNNNEENKLIKINLE
jgi:hypothetical protein